MDVELPSVGDASFPSVKMLLPVRSTDHMWVNASDDSICTLVQYIFAHGVTTATVTSKRSYYKRGGADDEDEDASALQDKSDHEVNDSDARDRADAPSRDC